MTVMATPPRGWAECYGGVNEVLSSETRGYVALSLPRAPADRVATRSVNEELEDRHQPTEAGEQGRKQAGRDAAHPNLQLGAEQGHLRLHTDHRMPYFGQVRLGRDRLAHGDVNRFAQCFCLRPAERAILLQPPHEG